MYIKELDEKDKTIKVAIPLVNGTGKTRIKTRSILNEYGVPFSTRSQAINQNCYVEWQIGYDVLVKDKEKIELTTLKDKYFIGSNGAKKSLYELSEYVYYFYKWDLITKNNLGDIAKFLLGLEEEQLFDNIKSLKPKRSQLVQKTINGEEFYSGEIEYSVLIHKFRNFEIITEIVVREKQYAIGVQPMLFLCFPITQLQGSENLIGRKANMKEEGYFMFDSSNYKVLLELLKIFGMLSFSHRADVLSIIKVILDS